MIELVKELLVVVSLLLLACGVVCFYNVAIQMPRSGFIFFDSKKGEGKAHQSTRKGGVTQGCT